MKIKNTAESFGLVAMAIHWLFALGVFGLFGLGLYMVELTYYDAWYKGSLDLHKSIGFTLFALLICRLVWRLKNIQPAGDSTKRWEQLSASVVHLLLYLIPLLLMVSGYLISTADDRGIEVFELFTVPSMGELIPNQEDSAGLVHLILAWLLIALASVHALAALKHHFINKNNTLNRMIGRSNLTDTKDS